MSTNTCPGCGARGFFDQCTCVPASPVEIAVIKAAGLRNAIACKLRLMRDT